MSSDPGTRLARTAATQVFFVCGGGRGRVIVSPYSVDHGTKSKYTHNSPSKSDS